MTVENCIKHLKAYKENAENQSLKSDVRKQSQKNYDNMKAHILSSRKFQGTEIFKELSEVKEEKETKSKKGK